MQIISDRALNAALNYNETEIRFHIIDPIIRLLGYPGEENVYLNLEEKLEYPFFHIGHRSKKDVPLGFPDYRAGLKGDRGSFIIEAKSGNIPITSREVEQAHSYAAHAQVGANYFVLCNGSIISVFETLSGPNAPALVEIPISEVNQRFYELENILSPTNLAKNCKIKHDKNLKISEGLGSYVRVLSGRYLLSDLEYCIFINGQDCTNLIRQSVPQIAMMDQQFELLKTSFELRVSGGRVERGVDGRINAHLEFDGATIQNHQAMEIMGITSAEFSTSDKFISNNSKIYTRFESTNNFAVPSGTMIPGFFGGLSEIRSDIDGDIFIIADMFYGKGFIDGRYIALSDQIFDTNDKQTIHFEMRMSGTFRLILDV